MAWSKIKDEFEIDDIGARLLANLAKGIYTHEAVLREYVQNAADAYEQLRASGSTVTDPTIKITVEQNKSLSIYDAGIGMNRKAIREAKKIAVSPKAGANLTGFRGIGIWAGFQACDSLEIVTTKKGDPHRYRLTIDFKDILKHVDDDINIKQLLDNRFRLEESDAPASEHYTQTTLYGLHAEYDKLLDAKELARIVAQNLPCRIDPKFKYKSEVEKFVHGAEGYQEYRVLVGKDEIFKDFPADIDAPQIETLKEGAIEIAKIWWCPGWNSLKPEGNQYRHYRLRVRNFAVGRIGIYDDEDGAPYGAVDHFLKMQNRLNWHVGEIHITNEKIVPDTPRNHLELDTLSRVAIAKIRGFYASRIAEAGARSEFRKMKSALEEGDEAFTSGTLTQEWANNLLTGLKEQEQLLVGKSPSNETKRQLRALLSDQAIKSARRKLIKNIEGNLKQLPKNSANAQQSSSKPATAAGLSTTNGAKVATTAGTVTGINFEVLLSDILGVINDKLTDDELITEVAEALQKVFEKHHLIENSK